MTFWMMLFAVVLLVGGSGPVAAQSDEGPTKDAIGRAIDFLLTQQKESGAITMGQHDTAMTAPRHRIPLRAARRCAGRSILCCRMTGATKKVTSVRKMAPECMDMASPL
jgi:hypothetical protein